MHIFFSKAIRPTAMSRSAICNALRLSSDFRVVFLQMLSWSIRRFMCNLNVHHRVHGSQFRDNSLNSFTHPVSLRSIVKLSSICALIFQVVTILQGFFPLKLSSHFPLERYITRHYNPLKTVKSNHILKMAHYVIFSIPLLRLSSIHIF